MPKMNESPYSSKRIEEEAFREHRGSPYVNYLLRKYFRHGVDVGIKLCKREKKVKKMELNVYTVDEFRKLEDVILELIDVVGEGITRTESAPMMITTPDGRQLLLKFEVRTVKWAQHELDRMEERMYHKQHELDEMINKSAQR